MSTPEISCIVPTHESPDLVARCLSSVAAQRNVRLEILVTDDSPTSRVRDMVSASPPLMRAIRFMEGPRTGNPVDNWNAGIAEAGAPLQVLVHQDEYLVDPLYLRRATDILNGTTAAATVAGVTVTALGRPSRFGLIAPMARRLRGARRLLPLINWIGPTAAFVFRAGPRFDPRFVQLVDVEFYGRVLKTGPLVRLPGVSVGSLGRHGRQISAGIDGAALACQELALMRSGGRPQAITPLEDAIFSAALRLKQRLG